ncbi:unnamed protein product [Fusarium graminearum]|uniref:Chromosome 3, complete genome n=1 Tax=Gibberella zeae (strain ATCC MYA-4620 / CBS 123657 / FGSC 9075 / NRRL 31084 / PH-1) TaxID=229533 RepID=I1S7M4_GIBZE|nr:hypothetical protein FGSG_12847 [Fusarium graminearum PH-1]ESU12011.1 hypothetical protein FGSG_12847 [Fusarium graminearum PH-1]CEF86147.1 unnamed protein product [Fusarium graminearum]CZS84697.1 unnamed protein product [Fusarium graminearum]|eukprot:XP_011324587.1 hypothetical protein FGSG_12847 [Fusarium graminearum PH-1]
MAWVDFLTRPAPGSERMERWDSNTMAFPCEAELTYPLLVMLYGSIIVLPPSWWLIFFDIPSQISFFPLLLAAFLTVKTLHSAYTSTAEFPGNEQKDDCTVQNRTESIDWSGSDKFGCGWQVEPPESESGPRDRPPSVE